MTDLINAAETAKSSPMGELNGEALREFLGKVVRQVWVGFAREQPNPKPHHLLPWEELDEDNKEVDRRIGVTLFEIGRMAGLDERDGHEPVELEAILRTMQVIREATTGVGGVDEMIRRMREGE